MSLIELANTAHDERLEPWAWSIGEATLDGLLALEARLHKRLALLRDREWSNDVERDALRLCAERREHLIAEAACAVPPSVPGRVPEATVGDINHGSR